MESLDKDFCLQKVESAIALIDRLLTGDHPHEDSQVALIHLKQCYENDRSLLQTLDESASKDTILGYCLHVNVNLVRLKEYIGLLLRSTNIRNAFELYFPIRILARNLIGDDAAVVLGSEWSFSPYTYPLAVKELPKFIFIGIPASECQNPLILPLAGHELGHVVWGRQGAGEEFENRVQPKIVQLYEANWEPFKSAFSGDWKEDWKVSALETNIFLQNIWAESFELAVRQLEELFCDFIGIFLFGQSFLHSFRYLVAPSLGRIRNVEYPAVRKRAEYMAWYAEQIGIPVPTDFVQSFREDEPNLTKQVKFVVSMADAATASLYPDLLPLVEKYRHNAIRFDTDATTDVNPEPFLRALVPPVKVGAIAAIVNAAWQIRLKVDDWDILKNIEDPEKRRREKLRVLRDLTLKSYEIYEYTKRVSDNAA